MHTTSRKHSLSAVFAVSAFALLGTVVQAQGPSELGALIVENVSWMIAVNTQCKDSNHKAVACDNFFCTYGNCQTGPVTACYDISGKEVPCSDPTCLLGLCVASSSSSSSQAVCGNNVKEDKETCDDGNKKSGDGCSNACRTENGFDCSSGRCVRLCGNSKVDAGEQCDDGNRTTGDGCNAACKSEKGFDCSKGYCTPLCGNGKIDSGEKCDDGNKLANDGCTSRCAIESGFTCTASATGKSACEKKATSKGSTIPSSNCKYTQILSGENAGCWQNSCNGQLACPQM